MSTPYPTKTRLALLRAVEAGNVIKGYHEANHTYWVEAPDEPFKVTARIAEADIAGWVELPEGVGPFWRLTAAGRDVLSAATR